jgi:hypothetical protein
MRFNATRFISIAALQSIAASSRQGRRHYRGTGGGGDKTGAVAAKTSLKRPASGMKNRFVR